MGASSFHVCLVQDHSTLIWTRTHLSTCTCNPCLCYCTLCYCTPPTSMLLYNSHSHFNVHHPHMLHCVCTTLQDMVTDTRGEWWRSKCCRCVRGCPFLAQLQSRCGRWTHCLCAVLPLKTWTVSHFLSPVSGDIGSFNNLVEAHCYGIGRTGQLLSNHVAVETD